MTLMSRVTVERTPEYLIVKIPLKAVAEGLHDIAAGRSIGPFASVRSFKAALRRRAV